MKFNLKTRLQWGWFKAALVGTTIGLLIAPALGEVFQRTDHTEADNREAVENHKKENPISNLLGNLSFGNKVKVMVNGEIVALAGSVEEGRDAYKAARLAYNAEGIKILDVDVTYEEVDKEKDGESVKGMHRLKDEELSEAILKSFSKYGNTEKALAYTMRIDDYTVTFDNMENLVAALERAQGKYDIEDSFQVELNPPASRNVMMYEVTVTEKNENSGQVEADGEQQAQVPEEGASDNENPEEASQSNKVEDVPQAAEDGVKYIGFSDVIQVVETYVSKDQIKDQETAYNELTTENQEAGIYVVQSGDYLDLIAEKNNMTVDEIRELNPGIETDEDLYYDDRLNIKVPRATVQILVEKQETYRETYYEDVVYEDDDSMFIGETEVVQEGSPGTHIVTDMVTYKDDLECDREQLEETVEVAAVAEIVKRGTKSQPTYMYPVTNWVLTSNFGYRWGRLHAGVDVGVPIGTTVRASRGGQIITAGWVGGYGNCVMIDHGDGIVTVYGHLSEVTVSVGQYVDQGQQVALSGNTGRSTGPHLHFEIRVNGTAEDPLPYLY